MTSEGFPTVILTVLRTTLETRNIHLKKNTFSCLKRQCYESRLVSCIKVQRKGAKPTEARQEEMRREEMSGGDNKLKVIGWNIHDKT